MWSVSSVSQNIIKRGIFGPSEWVWGYNAESKTQSPQVVLVKRDSPYALKFEAIGGEYHSDGRAILDVVSYILNMIIAMAMVWFLCKLKKSLDEITSWAVRAEKSRPANVVGAPVIMMQGGPGGPMYLVQEPGRLFLWECLGFSCFGRLFVGGVDHDVDGGGREISIL